MLIKQSEVAKKAPSSSNLTPGFPPTASERTLSSWSSSLTPDQRFRQLCLIASGKHRGGLCFQRHRPPMGLQPELACLWTAGAQIFRLGHRPWARPLSFRGRDDRRLLERRLLERWFFVSPPGDGRLLQLFEQMNEFRQLKKTNNKSAT